MSKGLTKKQKGFVKDLRAKIKNQIKGLTPGQKEERNKLIATKCREMEIAQWTPKEEDYWQYVYVVNCGEFHKIGIASNMTARFNGLQCGNPYPLKIVFTIRHPKADRIEKDLHTLFALKNHKREWFRLNEEDLNTVKEFIENYETKT